VKSLRPSGEVWATQSTIGGLTWYSILAVDVTNVFSLTVNDLYPLPSANTVSLRSVFILSS